MRRSFIQAGAAVQIIRDIPALRQTVAALRANHDGKPRAVALVPTMGSLHAGHMALITHAKTLADVVVASIFVNPTQFGPNEDFAAYPRDEGRDAALLTDHGCDLLWAPDVATMYPAGHATKVSVAGLDARHCGAARPGHFDGVATVVSKLFNQVQPDVAVFGEKDWQQLAIIRRMTADLDLPVAVHGLPTQRADDGLALSSRNAYLSPEQRAAAVALPHAMQWAAQQIAGGAAVAATLDTAQQRILAAGFGSIDYLTLVDAASLEPLRTWDAAVPSRLLGAARIGKTRLIDNWPVPLST